MAETPVDTTRLQDCPSWQYLLQEFDALYRMGSSGGSAIIRSHRKTGALPIIECGEIQPSHS
jgi:dimethylpropiothetin dethiomethylase